MSTRVTTLQRGLVKLLMDINLPENAINLTAHKIINISTTTTTTKKCCHVFPFGIMEENLNRKIIRRRRPKL